MMLDKSKISIFVGEKERYDNADIYTDFNDVYKVIEDLLTKGILWIL